MPSHLCHRGEGLGEDEEGPSYGFHVYCGPNLKDSDLDDTFDTEDRDTDGFRDAMDVALFTSFTCLSSSESSLSEEPSVADMVSRKDFKGHFTYT